MSQGLDAVQKLKASGELKKKVESALEASGSPNSSANLTRSREDLNSHLNILDKALRAAETMFSYMNPLSWFRSSSKPALDADVKEFDVVQSNWYWRRAYPT
jgi:hypothetical protein